MSKEYLESIIPSGEKELFGIDESKLPEEKMLTLDQKIKDICKSTLDVNCSVSTKKSEKLDKDQMTIKINQFLTDADSRAIIPEIEKIDAVKKVESVQIPEENVEDPTIIIVTLEK